MSLAQPPTWKNKARVLTHYVLIDVSVDITIQSLSQAVPPIDLYSSSHLLAERIRVPLSVQGCNDPTEIGRDIEATLASVAVGVL